MAASCACCIWNSVWDKRKWSFMYIWEMFMCLYMCVCMFLKLCTSCWHVLYVFVFSCVHVCLMKCMCVYCYGCGGGSGSSDAQVGRLRFAFSACGLDMRICELLLLRMDSCVPPFTPLLANDGWRCCFRSTAKYRFTVQLRHFLLISDCTSPFRKQ